MPLYPVDLDSAIAALDHYRKLYANTIGKDYQAFGFDPIDTLRYQTYLLEQIQILEAFIYWETV